MEAVDRPSGHRPSQPALGGAPPPKLMIEKFADGDIACLKFTGTIDEGFEGKKLGATATGDTLVLDLGGVKKISSFGIREWVDFVATAGKTVRSMILIECSPKVVDQLNMVANFAGAGRVFSFYAPFRCDYCDAEHRVLLQVDRDHETIKSMKLAERPCPTCHEAMYFDEDGATYFSYVLGQERFELEPEVAGFLASKLSYAVSELSRKLRIDKVIEGRTTYLRLAGDLDGGFPRDKLAEGLEGAVIVDLAALGRIEPAGAAAWRGFVRAASAIVERLYLAGVTPAFAEKLVSPEDLGPKGEVVTLTVPYACERCGTTTQELLEVATHHDRMKVGAAPELRCPACKLAMRCVASEVLIAQLPGLPAPTASTELVKSVGILRERALAAQRDKKPMARAPTLAAASAELLAQPAPRSSALVPVLAGLLVVVLLAAGYLAYERVTARAAPETALGTVTARSAEARPAWITTDTQGTATCSDTADRGLVCVGISSASARQDDAAEEAADAALDALANALAVRIDDAAWKAAVVPIYKSARDAKLAAFDRDPQSTTARRDVREARSAVGRLLRATSEGAVPAAPTGRYWEEYAGADGKRYVAFAQFTLSGTELAQLVRRYAEPASALGATAVPLFPLVGWQHPRLEHGAILTGLSAGPLQEAGLAAPYIVLAVAGRDVADARAFATIAAEEHAALADGGGALRLKVQADGAAPREFTATIAAPPSERPRSRVPAPARASETGLGGVNVWDRPRSAGSGRDDPTQ